MDVQKPEDEPPKRPLCGRHQKAPLDRGPGYFGKLSEKQPFPVVPERQGLDEHGLYLGPVHDQEKGDVEHEREIGQKAERVLAERHRVFGDEAADGQHRAREERLDAFEIIARVLEPFLKGRVAFLDPVDIAREGVLLGKQALIEDARLKHAVVNDVGERDDNQKKTQEDGDERGEHAPGLTAGGDGRIDGVEEDADGGGPENNVEKGQEHPEEQGRDPDEQGKERPVFCCTSGCGHGCPEVGG